MKPTAYILCVCLAAVLCSCNGNAYVSSVPAMPVYLSYNVLAEDPQFVPAHTGAYKLIKERRYDTDYIGYAGLLIYIGMDMNYHAFDLACPHCLSTKQPLEVDGMYAICPLCNEHYDVSYGYGTPTYGISREPLRKYNCKWDGTVLTVVN